MNSFIVVPCRSVATARIQPKDKRFSSTLLISVKPIHCKLRTSGPSQADPAVQRDSKSERRNCRMTTRRGRGRPRAIAAIKSAAREQPRDRFTETA